MTVAKSNIHCKFRASDPRDRTPRREHQNRSSDLQQRYAPWAELARKGIGVHCGECGCFSKTPYPVFTAWFKDVMHILKGHGIGYALWNFRGSFGILDSGRKDTEYEDWHGHQLARKLLAMLQTCIEWLHSQVWTSNYRLGM